MKSGSRFFPVKKMAKEASDWVTPNFVERLKSRDKEAFEELMTHFGPNLLKFGMKMCREREDALDIFQDTLLKAYSSIDQLKDPHALRSWLFKVAANACLKKKRKSKSFLEEISIEEVLPDRDVLEEEKNFLIEIEKFIEDKELKEKLKLAIESIPEKYRMVLLLRDMEGFSTEETAKILNLSEDVVKMRLHRARGKVRELLLSYIRRHSENVEL